MFTYRKDKIATVTQTYIGKKKTYSLNNYFIERINLFISYTNCSSHVVSM